MVTDSYSHIKRPLFLRLVPPRLAQSLFYRWFSSRHHQWQHLFRTATLRFAPNVSMSALVPGDIISGSIAFTGFYELDLTRYIRSLSINGGLLVDVGANLGYFSLLWAAGNAGNRAIAFEASPTNVPRLASNIESNALSSRVTLKPFAVGHSIGTMVFDPGPEDQTGWGGFVTSPCPLSVQVTVTTLDAELVDTAIDLLKIDVEGADTWVLRGCQTLLAHRRIKTIVFEQNRPRMEALGISPDEAPSLLRTAGYRCAPLSSNQETWMAFPE